MGESGSSIVGSVLFSDLLLADDLIIYRVGQIKWANFHFFAYNN